MFRDNWWFTYVDITSRITIPILSLVFTLIIFNFIKKRKEIDMYPFIKLKLNKFNHYAIIMVLSFLSNFIIWFLFDWIIFRTLILLFVEPGPLITIALSTLTDSYFYYVMISSSITIIFYLILKKFSINLTS